AVTVEGRGAHRPVGVGGSAARPGVLQSAEVGGRHSAVAHVVLQQRLHLHAAARRRDPPHRRGRQTGRGSALGDHRGPTRHRQQGGDRRQRRHPRTRDPGGDHPAPGRRVPPGLGDTLVVDDTTGKATLVVRVSEGDPYRVGTFEIVGNRRFSTEDLEQLFPFKGATRTGLLGLGGVQQGPAYFNQQKWDDATQQMRTLYYNNGYIYMQPRADVIRRTGADGKPVADLRWVITEGQPAIVNKVEIAGNDVTHARVIR